jgi:hypothetical protein
MAEYQDLLKDTSQSYDNGDYFIVTIPGLIPGTIYPLEFRWKYKDGTFGEDWSAVKTITAPSESIPQAPKLNTSDVTYSQGIITVKWSGKNSAGNDYSQIFSHVNVYLQRDDEPPLVYIFKGIIPISGGTLSIPVVPAQYSVKIKSVNKSGLESGFSEIISVTAKATPPVAIASVTPAWSGTDFTVSFNSDKSAVGNEQLDRYIINLISGSSSYAFQMVPSSGATQKFSLSLAENVAAFGVPQTSFSGSVSTVDVYGNVGTPVSFGAHVYVNNLPAPTITVTEAVEGYTVSYTTPTDKTFSSIEIQEVESTATNDPAFGYETCFSGSSNPVVITRSNQNKRWVRARFIANNGSAGQYGTAVFVTPKSVVVADLIPPTNPTGIGAVATVDAYDQTGFRLSSRISWTASTDTSTRGYRLRWSPDNPATVPNPNWEYGFTNAISFTASGLIPNVTYYYQVASVDQYNNTQTYSTTQTFTAADGAATAVNAAARLKSILAIGGATGDLFKFGTGIPDSINTSITTTPTNSPSPIGGYHGILLNKTGNKNNYWLTTGQLRVGTDTQFMYFNGTSLYLTGNINAASGSFTGNVNIASGGSLYSGAINPVNSTGAGYILNSSGLTFNSVGTNGITTINGTTGKLTTASASIGNWDVSASAISKTSSSGTITLNSSTAQITVSSAAYQAGIATPNTNAAADIVFWAGGARGTSANFYVQANGTVVMKSATITGYASSDALTTGLGTKIGADQVNANVTSISGGVITSGVIKSSNFSGTATGASYSTAGTAFDLVNGTITAKQFRIDTSGNAKFAGELVAASGSFSGGVTATSFSFTAGTALAADYWKSDGSFQFGGSTGITKAASGSISIGSNVTISGNLTATSIASTATITAGQISSGGMISGSGINATGGTFNTGVFDSDSGSWTGSEVTGAPFTTAYTRNNIVGVGLNAVSFISVNTGGWVSSCYPYYDGGSDLGVKSTGTTNAYRWRNLRLTNAAYFGGDGSTNTPGTGTANPKIAIFGSGSLFADSLNIGGASTGASTGSPVIQNSSGYIKVSGSSRKFKENIYSLPKDGYLDALMLVNPVNFNYIGEDEVVSGLIAEELDEIDKFKGVVNYDLDGAPVSISYDRMSALLVLAIKEIKDKIDGIEQRLDALEG